MTMLPEDNAERLLALLDGPNPALLQGVVPTNRSIPVFNGGSHVYDATDVPSAFGLQPLRLAASAPANPWELYLCDASGGDIEITLPDPTAVMGLDWTEVGAKLLSATGTVTLLPFASETIEGGASLVLDTQYASAVVITDGTDWWVMP